MAIFAIAVPILPGQTDGVRNFTRELMGARHADFHASREAMGVHERTFLQQTPMGDMVIVTLEGADPSDAIQKFGAADDEFTNWFVEQVKALHGIDLKQPLSGALPELVADSD